ncbi:MAG: polysaccharide biosynthesis tyrosine autokinase [Proteobacteria bacterium]|nr:polysaccharide biosynthesis tyrosine autokinase [Pseudomonadota bacterium]
MNNKNNELIESDNLVQGKGYNKSSYSLDTSQYDIDIREIILLIIRRKKIVFAVIFFCAAAMFVFLSLQTPLYTATSVIHVNSTPNNIVDFEAVVSGAPHDEAAIQSEIDILKSRYLASRVIEKLHLTNDPEFNSSAGEKAFGWLSNEVSTENKPKEDIERNKRIALTRTINSFLGRISIHRESRSYTIKIKFTSSSPEKAALIANTITEEYLISQLSSKFEATKRANDWLNKKLNELQKKVHQSEMAVQMFKEQNDLIETSGMTISDQQLSELNTHLILASTELAHVRARLESSKSSIASSPEVLGSSLIQSLRGQESEVLRKKSDLTSRYGPRHPKMINVNAELRDLRNNINVEIAKIKSGLEKEVEIAQAREDSLKKSLMKAQGKVGETTKSRVQLEELTREMNANRSLYESFLVRSKETSQNIDLDQSHAKVISEAEIPLSSSYPKKKLSLALTIIFGTGLGVFLVFILEYLDNVFKNYTQLEDTTSVAAIGMVPELKENPDFVKYVSSNLSSFFVESLRSILTAAHFSNPDDIPKTILITSSVPSEGKTTLAVTMASVAAKSGKEVLLVDCDMKKPNVAKYFSNKDVKYCIGDYLTGKANEKEVINIDKSSGLHYICSHSNTANSQNLLLSIKMKDFISDMSNKYDLVIIDSPPLMAVSDSLIIARLVDAVLFTVRWNKTPRPVVKTNINQLKTKDIWLAGTILTYVDLEKYSKGGYGNESYYYKNYQDTYTE